MSFLRAVVLKFLIATLTFASTSVVHADFDLQFDFEDQTQFSESQLSIFADVETRYESLITGYQMGVDLTGAIIDVSAGFIDGPINFDDGTGTIGGSGGGMTSSANPTPGGFSFFIIENTTAGDVTTGSLLLDEDDLMTFEDAPNGLFSLIFHEVGHALGFGTLWEENNLLNADNQYIGSNGLAEYQSEFDATASFVPTDGSEADGAGHWDEDSLLGSDILSPVLVLGGDNPISETTISSFADLGYTVAVAVPEPGSTAALSIACLFGASRRRRRSLSTNC